MDRKHRTLLALAFGGACLMNAVPAYAQATQDTVGAVVLLGVSICTAVASLIMFGFWAWMLADAIRRHEWEYAGSKGNSKTVWIGVLLLGAFLLGVPAVAYYFRAYSPGPKAGTTGPDGPAPPLAP